MKLYRFGHILEDMRLICMNHRNSKDFEEKKDLELVPFGGTTTVFFKNVVEDFSGSTKPILIVLVSLESWIS